MTSEIRTNSLKSRAGLSTVTMTDSGPMFSGITTFVDNSGFTFGVGGGTSIFTPATNVLTFGTNNTEKVRIDANGNANITGVTTAANFKTGVSNLHDVGLTLTGGQIDVGSNIKIGTAGVVTATSFVGDGSNLTGLTVPGGATNLDLLDSSGTGNGRIRLGASQDLQIYHDGSHSWFKNTTGRLILQTDGDQIQIRGNTIVAMNGAGNSAYVRIDSSGRVLIGTTTEGNSSADNLTVADSGESGITVRSGASNGGHVYFSDATSGTAEYQGAVSYQHNGDFMKFNTGASERLRISNTGQLGVSHDLSGTANYNRLMLHNPHDGSCWIQMTSTASGSSANTDGLSIGLNNSNVGHIWLRENADMYFATNNSLRWRITSSGDVYPQGNYKIGLNSNTAFRMDEVNSNKFVHRYGNSGSATNNQQEAIWYGGGITVMHDNATLSTSNYTWGLTGHRGYPLFRVRNSSGQAIYAESGSISSGSDYRMKENIEEITNGIETVKKLKPSKYNIRKSFNPLDDGKKHHGFIAHEVQEAIPDIGNIVSGTKDGMEEVFYGVDDDEVIPEGFKAGDSTGTFTDKPDMQGIDYGHMTPVLAAAIKELITKVETLEQDNITLRARVTNLEGN